jgi:hypothetical protein
LVRDRCRVCEKSVDRHKGDQRGEYCQEGVKGNACGEQGNIVPLGLFPAAFGDLEPAAWRDLCGSLGLTTWNIDFALLVLRGRDGLFPSSVNARLAAAWLLGSLTTLRPEQVIKVWRGKLLLAKISDTCGHLGGYRASAGQISDTQVEFL